MPRSRSQRSRRCSHCSLMCSTGRSASSSSATASASTRSRSSSRSPSRATRARGTAGVRGPRSPSSSRRCSRSRSTSTRRSRSRASATGSDGRDRARRSPRAHRDRRDHRRRRRPAIPRPSRKGLPVGRRDVPGLGEPARAGPYWGQVDAVGTVPFLLALIFAGRGSWATAGAIAGLAAMVKPQFGIALIVVAAGALFIWIRDADWRPPLRTAVAALLTILALGVPFRAGPGELIDLVRSASETYPFTSLYAFNIWSIVGDFWKPDDQYVVLGAILLLAGLASSCALLWWRRDVGAFLACGALAAFAFYFLPTRAHERYLFPAFALLLPLAVLRARLLVPYISLAIAFAASLYFAFTRYPQNDLRSPQWLEDSLFTRNGQIALALLMLGLAAFC